MSALIKTSHGSLWRLLSPQARLRSLLGYALALTGAWLGGQADVPGAHILDLNIWDFALILGLWLAIQDLFGTGTGCARAAFVLRMPRIVVVVQRRLLGLGLVLLLPLLALAWLAHDGMGMLAMAVTCLCAISGFAISQLVTDKRSSFLGMWVPLLVIMAGVGPLERGEHPWGLTVLALVTAAMLATMVGLWRYMLSHGNWKGRAGPSGSSLGSSRKLNDPWMTWNQGIDTLGRWLHLFWLSNARVMPDIQRTGSEQPLRSLRMSIGGLVLPQTRLAQFGQHCIFILLMATPAGIIWTLLVSRGMGGYQALAIMATGLTSFVCSWLTLANATRIRHLWSRTNAELPLLALLPGLPRDGVLRRMLRQATNHTPWKLLCLQLTGCLLVVWAWGGTPVAWPLSGLALGLFLGNALAVAVLPVLAMAPRAGFRHGFEILSAALALMVLISISALLFPTKLSMQALYPIDLAWLVLLLVMAVTGWMCQRRWRCLPHPFLASTP